MTDAPRLCMVLTNLGEQVNYYRLLQRLGTTNSGTPFPNLARLRSFRFTVDLGSGNLGTLRQRLEARQPIIVPVATELLPYWLLRTDLPEAERMTEHAVVVIGIDETPVYMNDPDFDAAPLAVEREWLEDAWHHHERQYTVIRRRWR